MQDEKINDEFEHGLSIIHDRLMDAVECYEQYLMTFGTVPAMDIVEDMKKLVDRVLIHDDIDVRPFRKSGWQIKERSSGRK